ncbi:uncharacterized protein LOC126672469 [Mercurialis annua]|uniref:uncharacterized protein LOC126672469 n=1 Tax=Mercurialis annua TaxID=3986 RepID=UPI00215F2EB3|nr:uncharacterized protein LOC126672469 [Mercurialis annua]
MDTDRSWMYRRLHGGLLYPGFTPSRVQEFVNFALRHPACMSGPQIKCPCPKTRCKNTSYRDVETVKLHILQKGFVADYQVWVFHGEGNVLNPRPVAQLREYDVDMENEGGDDFSSVQRMEPNNEANHFYDMMRAAEEPVFPGNSKHSLLSAAVKMLDIKCRHSGSVALVDDVTEFIQELLPEENKMPKNFAEIKKMVRGLGLPVEVIDCCLRNCMIYWGSDADLMRCKICDHERWKPPPKGNSVKRRVNVPYRKMFYFPITPRLQRLYASKATAKHMTWHAEHKMVDGKMCHPSDSPAWKHFSELHTEFAEEVRNIRLGLCTDGFQPFRAFGQNYSSWPVILTPYNLPPGMCMKDEFMFLTVIVPGPRNPKHQMDIFLQPLIAELNHLWEFGVQTFDVHRRQNFQLKAALMWTINDFPAYFMLSGWSTSGRLACPHCMENTDAFTLNGSRKKSWFDCHRKFLPRGHIYRRNTTDFRKGKTVNKEFSRPKTGEELLAEVDHLGFMKAYEIGAGTNNAAKSTDYGKTKDHAKSREELNDICDRPELAKDPITGRFPKALYALDKDGKKALLEWIKLIRFPDGYASNLSRCVDTVGLKMHGMKSHDCHIFMQRLLPIALRELLPKEVWEPLTELSIFFRELTSTSLTEKDLDRMRLEIPKILCKLERIFPPSFFDSMEHLPVHLPYEAMIAGPVQYRWMYPFERYLRKLKKKVGNKGKVEGSISSGYLNEETAKFAAYYFSEGDPMVPERLQRNEVCDIEVDDDVDRLSIFKPHGQSVGACRKRYLEEAEIVAARTYVLIIVIFFTKGSSMASCVEETPKSAPRKLKRSSRVTLPSGSNNILAKGPLRSVRTFKGYRVNGYKFQTQAYGEEQLTMNSGVCVKGTQYVDSENDFYGDFPEKWDAIAQRLAAATQSQTGEGSSASPAEVNETQLFLDIEGVNKKHRVYGLGSASSSYAGPSSRTQRGSSSRTSQQTEEEIDRRVQAGIQEGLREVEQRLAEKQRQELAEQLAAARREQQESMAQLIREEVARLMPTLPAEYRSQFPPPPPDGDDTTDL